MPYRANLLFIESCCTAKVVAFAFGSLLILCQCIQGSIMSSFSFQNALEESGKVEFRCLQQGLTTTEKHSGGNCCWNI
jgi:hypothetical protein